MDSIMFLSVDLDDTWTNQINSIYQTHSIYRSIIVVDDKDTLSSIKMYLDSDEHFSYYTLGDSNYIDEYKSFIASNNRILLLEYSDFVDSYHAFHYILKNNHNLLVLENLESFQEKIILDMMKSVLNTELDLPYYIWLN